MREGLWGKTRNDDVKSQSCQKFLTKKHYVLEEVRIEGKWRKKELKSYFCLLGNEMEALWTFYFSPIFCIFKPGNYYSDTYKGFSRNQTARLNLPDFGKKNYWQNFYTKFQQGTKIIRDSLKVLLSYLLCSQIWLNLFHWWSPIWQHHETENKEHWSGTRKRLV